MLALVSLIAVGMSEQSLRINEKLFMTGAQTAIIILVVLSFSFFLDLYRPDIRIRPRSMLIRVISANTLSLSALLILSAMPIPIIDRSILFWFFGVFGVPHALWHIGCEPVLDAFSSTRKILIIGQGPLANRIREIISSNQQQYVLAGHIPCSGPEQTQSRCVVGPEQTIIEAVKTERPRKIVVSLPERRGSFPAHDLLACKLSGIEILDAPSFYEQITRKILIENITPSWFIFSTGFKVHSFARASKRAMDIVLASVALLLAFPLFLIIALLIKADSAGPVFFQQTRTGENEQEFTVYKFRTMREHAEKETGAVWAQENDPRITRIGRFLRKMRIDELPQFYNVLRGDMSMVGPRPERPEFANMLKEAIPFYSARHVVKPGITGWAQINYPYGASIEDAREKLRYDLFYIKHLSLGFDFLILLETIKVVAVGRGGR